MAAKCVKHEQKNKQTNDPRIFQTQRFPPISAHIASTVRASE